MQLRFVLIFLSCVSCISSISLIDTQNSSVTSFLTSAMSGRYIKNIQEVQDGAAKITAIAWSHNNMKLAVCTADRVPTPSTKVFSDISLFLMPGCSSL